MEPVFNWLPRFGTMHKLCATVWSFVYNGIIMQYIGNAGAKFFPFFFYLFNMLVIANVFGLLPGFFSITSQITVTLFLASIS